MLLTEISEQYGISRIFINRVTREYGIQCCTGRKNGKQVKIFSDEQVRKIVKLYDKDKKPAAENKMTVEELKAGHPLVTDERCFRLEWFPDIVPVCFLDEEGAEE